MNKQIITESLKSCLKTDLEDLALKMDIKNIKELRKPELKEAIIKKNGLNNYDLILYNSNKKILIQINKYFKMAYTGRSNDILIKQVKEYIQKHYNNSSESIGRNQEGTIEQLVLKNNINTNVTYDNIIRIIENINYSEYTSSLKRETNFRDLIRDYLSKENYIVHTELRIGHIWDLSIDIDINDQAFGIEVKFWKSINLHDLERAIGQAFIYTWQRYKDNSFLLLLFVTKDFISKDIYKRKIQRLQEHIESMKGKLHVQVYK